jgi:hypothetical protein
MLNQLELKMTRTNTIIIYNIYANIDKIIQDINKVPISLNDEQPIKIIKETKDKE